MADPRTVARAKSMIAELVQERNAEFRGPGVRDIAIGAVMAVVCLGLLIGWWSSHIRAPGGLLAAIGAGAFSGVGLVGRGAHRMVYGSPNRKG
jgi:hypothetical protein